jgi:hypothetical protein
MANRSYLYTVDVAPTKKKTPKPIRSLSEWGWDIPLSHKILASEGPKRCQSAIWGDHEIGVVADFAAGRDRLLALLDVLAKAKPKNAKAFAAAAAETKKTLASKKHAGKFTLLECGEIFDMLDDDLTKSADRLVEKDIAAVRKKVDAAIAGKEKAWVAKLAKSWEKDLGLYWADVLYFDFNAK